MSVGDRCERDGCTLTVPPRRGNSRAQAEARRFCSLACYRAHVHVERPRATCEVCLTAFGPSARERPAQFVKRAPRFCSQACNGAAKAAGRDRAIPRCAVCSCEIPAQTGDTPSQHARRRRCPDHTGLRVAGTSTTTRRKAPAPNTAAPRVIPSSPPWRPAGFSAVPRTSRAAS